MRPLVLFLSFPIAFSAFGDTITLKSGGVVEGRVIQLREESIVVRLASGEVVKIPKDSIQWIGYSEPPEWQKPGVEIPKESEIRILKDSESDILKPTQDKSTKPSTFAEWERRGYKDGMRVGCVTCWSPVWLPTPVPDPPRIREASPEEWEAYMLGYRNAMSQSRQASCVAGACSIALLGCLLSLPAGGPGVVTKVDQGRGSDE